MARAKGSQTVELRGRNPIRVGTPLTRTVKEPYAKWPQDAYTPDWDRIPGMSQHSMRVSMKDRPDFDADSNHPPVVSNKPKV